jgi:hypothetical protein
MTNSVEKEANNITLSDDVLAEAKELGINISQVCNQYLRELVHGEREPVSLNPYHVDGQDPTLRPSVYVYMDMLAYKEIVHQSKTAKDQQEMLRKLHHAFKYARAVYLESDKDDPLLRLYQKQNYALKAFTDNIVMGWPIRKNPQWELDSAFRCLKHFQFQLVIEGFFIRGAISLGDAYIDEVAVFGGAVLEAYEGEVSLARDPRIVLTQSAVNVVQEHNVDFSRDILRDSDGQLFLNYLDSVLIAEDEYGPIYEGFLKHKTIVEEKLNEYKENPPLWSKYAWVAGYHNYFCDQYTDYFTDEHKINVELFRATPTRIDD